MQQIIEFIIFTIIFLIITYQDFKDREISIWLLPLLLIVALLKYNYVITLQYITTTATNLIFLFIQFVLLNIYYGIKKKKIINIINTQIGLGDLLFFIVLAFVYPTIEFILIFTFGLLFSLIVYLILRIIKLIKQESIPLAGIFSIFLLLIKITVFFTSYNFMNNYNIIVNNL